MHYSPIPTNVAGSPASVTTSACVSKYGPDSRPSNQQSLLRLFARLYVLLCTNELIILGLTDTRFIS